MNTLKKGMSVLLFVTVIGGGLILNHSAGDVDQNRNIASSQTDENQETEQLVSNDQPIQVARETVEDLSTENQTIDMEESATQDTSEESLETEEVAAKDEDPLKLKILKLEQTNCRLEEKINLILEKFEERNEIKETENILDKIRKKRESKQQEYVLQNLDLFYNDRLPHEDIQNPTQRTDTNWLSLLGLTQELRNSSPFGVQRNPGNIFVNYSPSNNRNMFNQDYQSFQNGFDYNYDTSLSSMYSPYSEMNPYMTPYSSPFFNTTTDYQLNTIPQYGTSDINQNNGFTF